MKGFKGILLALIVVSSGIYFGFSDDNETSIDARGQAHHLVQDETELDSISQAMGYRVVDEIENAAESTYSGERSNTNRKLVARHKSKHRKLKGKRGVKKKLKKKKLAKKKKKKKKKKKNKKKKTTETQIAENDSTDRADEPEYEPFEPAGDQAGGVLPLPGGNKRGNGELETVEDWLEFIGARPSPKKTERVISALRAEKLTAGQVTEIALTLIERGGERATIEAIKLLGETPSDIAYNELAIIHRGGFPAKVKTVAAQFRRSYQFGEKIRFLTAVITQPEFDSSVRQLAISDAQVAARTSGGSENSIFALDENNQFTHPSAIQLSNLASAVESQHQRETDGNLRRIMGDLLNNLDQVLGGRNIAGIDDDVTSFDQ